MDVLLTGINRSRRLPTEDQRPEGRVLVVDRDRNARATIESLLTMAGCEVATAASAAVGLRCVREWNPTLVLLDPTHHRRAPDEVIRAFWDAGQRRVPLVLLGDKGLPRNSGIEAMISGVLPKPFDVRDLLTTTARFVTCGRR